MEALPIANDYRAKTVAVPTDDAAVRQELRKLGEPVTLFGEDKPQRRERLHTLWSEQKHTDFAFAAVEAPPAAGSSSADDAGSDDDDEFYTPGTPELLEARTAILHYSVQRARERVQQQREFASRHDFTQVLRHRRAVGARAATCELTGSYTLAGNTRALSCVRFGRDGRVACASWDGSIHVLAAADGGLAPAGSVHGAHAEKATLAWSCTEPEVLVSGGGEGTAAVWRAAAGGLVQQASVAAHGARVAQVAVHPSGAYFCTTSFDQTWKLWDMRRPHAALVEQEGHAKEVYACGFHPDGSLLATGGLDAIGRVWDLRSGRSAAVVDTHVKGIYSMAWAPNGHHLASGSGDNSVRVWDMRKRGELFCIPAHTKLVSDVRFVTGAQVGAPVADESGREAALALAGTLLATASYDGSVKLWSADNWVAVASLRGHTDKVMSCDVSDDGGTVVSCGWDRTLRTFSAGSTAPGTGAA